MAKPVTESESARKAEEGKAPGVGVVPLMMAVVVAVLVAVASLSGALYWMTRTGKLPGGGGVQKVEAATQTPAPTTHDVSLEPLLVNLADEGGRAYLRIAVTLSLADALPAKGAKAKEEKTAKGKEVVEHEAAIRDAALQVIGSEKAESLLALDGKERLKARLRKALVERVPEVKVTDLYFTEFLVQR